MWLLLKKIERVTARVDVIWTKLKEVLMAVLPIAAIVLILHASLTPLPGAMLAQFLIGTALTVIGLTVFLIGVDVGVTPIGQAMGSVVARSNKLWIVIVAGLALGFIISIAEPDLHILAGQVDALTAGQIPKMLLVVVVSLGIAVLMTLGMVRVVYNIPLYLLLTGLYGLVLILSLFSSREFLAISFDASGATTGAMTVPFMLALALGATAMKKDAKASEKDSFGLVGTASIGAILAVLLMSVVAHPGPLTGTVNGHETAQAGILRPFFNRVPITSLEVFMAMSPILALLLVFQKKAFKLSRRSFRRMLVGLGFTLVGLVLFLVGVHAGFMSVGTFVGQKIASLDRTSVIVLVGFAIGMVTILAEPAVYVLTHQVESVTSGYVRRSLVLGALALGAGLSVGLSMLRILVPAIQLWHYLLPGYIIAIGLTYVTPKLFIGIAFDSGGVASGPMTATFILAFTNGVASASEGANVLVDGFGMIAMVALMPVIALQILGLVYKIKTRKGGVEA